MTTIWPRWSNWLATQPAATQSFESDVAGMTAEAIANTRDPNRRGRPRVDFCVHLVDGDCWRFHPGRKVKDSAEPVHIPATLPDATRGAAEHAATQWTTFGQGNVWTIAHAALVPQTDRMGKQAVWHQIAALLKEDTSLGKDGLIDITRDTTLPWWLWASNLGQRTRDVIGEGIRQVHLSRTGENEVLFKCMRVDDTTVPLLLGLHGSRVYTRYR